MAKKKQEAKLKEPVRIRFKQLANGNQSIYLDYYTGDVIRKENYVGGKWRLQGKKCSLICSFSIESLIPWSRSS